MVEIDEVLIVCWSHNFLVHGPDIELVRLHNHFIPATTSIYLCNNKGGVTNVLS